MKKKLLSLLVIPLLLSACSNNGGDFAYNQMVKLINTNISSPEEAVEYVSDEIPTEGDATYTGKTFFAFNDYTGYNRLEEPLTGSVEAFVVYRDQYLQIIDPNTSSVTSSVTSGQDYYLGYVNARNQRLSYLTGGVPRGSSALECSRELDNAALFTTTVDGDNYNFKVKKEESNYNGMYVAIAANEEGSGYYPQYQEEVFNFSYDLDYNALYQSFDGGDTNVYICSTSSSLSMVCLTSPEISTSTLLGVPMQINKETFYSLTSNGSISTSCSYSRIKQALVWSIVGYDYELRMGLTKDNHLIFYAPSSNMLKIFSAGIFSENDQISISNKSNMAVEYDEQGRLVRETYVSLMYYDKNVGAYADYIYTYGE